MGITEIALTLAVAAAPIGFAADHVKPRRPMLARAAYVVGALLALIPITGWAVGTL